ncbi:class I SAM-dependent methyltransferase [Patescibacteria group bacterium]|nr:class I SAM-dependent methyltransferase [Patescibacteria group bacterium]
MNNKFICPNCAKNLEFIKNKCLCSLCGAYYQINNGIISFVDNDCEKNNFDDNLCKSLFKMEKKHFWHTGRKEIIWQILNFFTKEKINNLKMLDIGCGNGNIPHYLKTKGINIEGADTSLSALNFCKKRVDIPLYQIDPKKQTLPFLSESYDIVGLFDVLEHVEKDQSLLSDVFRICKKEGKIIITVPANKYLWSYFDIISGHKRRYSKNDLIIKLEKAGFKIEKISFYMFFLLPFMFFRKLKFPTNKNKNGQFDSLPEIKTIPIINDIFLLILKLEKKLLLRFNLPFGSSIICIAKK